VSTGEKDVCSAVMDDAGDSRLRSFERSFRRKRCGKKSLMVHHGNEMLDLEKTLCGCSVHDSTALTMAFCSLARDANGTHPQAHRQGLIRRVRWCDGAEVRSSDKPRPYERDGQGEDEGEDAGERTAAR
jgi:hypothetical protein